MVNPAIQDRRRYVRLSVDGMGSFITEPHEADAMVRDEPNTPYKREDVWLTPEQFELLPEFTGF
jgi:hypothetical protein